MTLSINFFFFNPKFWIRVRIRLLTGNLLFNSAIKEQKLNSFLSWNCKEGKVTTWKESVNLHAVSSFELCILLTGSYHDCILTLIFVDVGRSYLMDKPLHSKTWRLVLQQVGREILMFAKYVFVQMVKCFWHQLTAGAKSAYFVNELEPSWQWVTMVSLRYSSVIRGLTATKFPFSWD